MSRHAPIWGPGPQTLLRASGPNPFPGMIGTFMGRDALSLAVSVLNLRAGDIVLMPAYLCREVLRPFLGRSRVEFYDVRPDLTIDPEEIRSRLSETAARMVLIINYFGFLQPGRKEISEICRDRGTVLLEDCAHSLLTDGSGETGDLSVYSFRKILPVPDGGGLQLRGRERPVTAEFYPRAYSNLLSVLIVLKSLLQVRAGLFSRAGLADRITGPETAAAAERGNQRVLPLSSFTGNGMRNASFTDVIDRRRKDYEHWRSLSARTGRFVPIFPELPPGVCPLGFPVRTDDRDAMKSRLLEKGILLKIHWNLPGEVGRQFVSSHELARQTITFPIYPELTDRTREEIERLFDS